MWDVKHLTSYFVVIVFLFYIAWDFFAYAVGGGEATESTTVGTWMSSSLWVTAAVVLLIGHLCGSGPDKSFTWKHLVVCIVCFPLGVR